MTGRDPMTMVKLLVEERLIDDQNRALPAKDVVVERTLIGRPMDRLSLVTALNCLGVTDATPVSREVLEIQLRRGQVVINAFGTYRVAPSQVVPDWTPTPEVAP